LGRLLFCGSQVTTGSVTVQDARWFADGQRLLIIGTETSRTLRAYVTNVAGSPPRAITPEGISYYSAALSPDGKGIALRSPEGLVMIYPTDGGSPARVKGLEPDEVPTGWTADSRAMLVAEGLPPRRVVRVDPMTGQCASVKEIRPSDAALQQPPTQIVLAQDGRSYAINYERVQKTLFLVDGLR
jgi:hypothetical protein